MPITDGWGIGTAEAVRIGGMSAALRTSPSRSRAADLRRFRVEHALRAIEDAMALLRGVDVHGVECSLLIVDLQNPYRYLEIRGRARIEPGDDYEFADRVGKKYAADLRVHDKPGQSRVVVTIDPVRVHAIDMSG